VEFFLFNLSFNKVLVYLYYMCYFNYSVEDKYNLRRQLIYLVASTMIRVSSSKVNLGLSIIMVLNNIKDRAIKKEHYEMVELINDIFKNKDYQIYEL